MVLDPNIHVDLWQEGLGEILDSTENGRIGWRFRLQAAISFHIDATGFSHAQAQMMGVSLSVSLNRDAATASSLILSDCHQDPSACWGQDHPQRPGPVPAHPLPDRLIRLFEGIGA
jgi:hypothetical protein